MGTVVFDFDSTLIRCESLEKILEMKGLSVAKLNEVKEITRKGMEGEISFIDSLKRRLNSADLNLKDFEAFGKEAANFLTPGMEALIEKLQESGTEVWIVSGTAKEAMLPLAKRLKIPHEQMLGVQLEWEPDGALKRLDDKIAINRSKWEGAKEKAKKWSPPTVAVGDGITDFALYEQGVVEHFVAFTGNVSREALKAHSLLGAGSAEELKTILEGILHG